MKGKYLAMDDAYKIANFNKLLEENNKLKEENTMLKSDNNILKEAVRNKDKTEIYIDSEDMEERYCEGLYQDYLEKENQELKKQLENRYCNRIDCSSRIKDSKRYDSLVQRVEKQQNEFINLLEKMYFETEDIWYIKILTAYKKIMGVENASK